MQRRYITVDVFTGREMAASFNSPVRHSGMRLLAQARNP
jgi:hypothetical protein